MSSEEALEQSAQSKSLFGRLSEACTKQDTEARYGLAAEEAAHLLLIDHGKKLEKLSDAGLASFLQENAALLKNLSDQKAMIHKDALAFFQAADTQKRFGLRPEEAAAMLIEPMAVSLNEEEGSEPHIEMFLTNLEESAHKKGIKESKPLTREEVARLTTIVERSPYMRQE